MPLKPHSSTLSSLHSRSIFRTHLTQSPQHHHPHPHPAPNVTQRRIYHHPTPFSPSPIIQKSAVSNEMTTIISNARTIQLDLQSHNLSKWGYIVYRTSYASSSEWSRFCSILTHRALQVLRESDAPELAESFEYTFVDATAGASVEELRGVFREWRGSEAARAEQPFARGGVIGWWQARYEFFVRADEGVIASVSRGEGEGCVQVVQAGWEPDSSSAGEGREGDEGAEEHFEALEGCTEEDVGWLLLPVERLPVDAYLAFGTTDGWTLEYVRPPGVSGGLMAG